MTSERHVDPQAQPGRDNSVSRERRDDALSEYVVQVDPLLRRLHESPYDPVASAQATGWLTGVAASSTVLRGWMRPLGYLLSFALLANLLILANIAVSELRDHPLDQALFQIGSVALFAVPMSIAGVLLLWRLLSTRDLDEDERGS
jgi:hypothetical protein